jgi:hypothetical protein
LARACGAASAMPKPRRKANIFISWLYEVLFWKREVFLPKMRC